MPTAVSLSPFDKKVEREPKNFSTDYPYVYDKIIP